MISLIIVLAIIISIALGYKTKINTGLFAIAFAYIIGCYGLKLKASNIISMWPISIFFVILATSLFYNFALVNGTLEKLSMSLLYLCRRAPRMLPFAIFLAATLISALGAGYFSVMVLLVPITLLICEKMEMDPLIGALAANYGALVGANFMTSGSGVVFKGLMETAGYGNSAFSYGTTIFIATMIIPIAVLGGYVLFSKDGKKLSKHMEITKPEPFNKKQRLSLALIVIMMVIVLVPPILHIIFSKNATITFINSKVDVGLIAIIFSVIASVLNLADTKSVIKKVPWNTLIMICGVGILIAVAIKAGTIKILANWVGGNIPTFMVPIALCIIGGIMSFFSSTLGVVCPALFPIVPSIASATGLNPMLLFTSIIIGAQATSISPFSSGGSLVLGSCASEDESSAMFPRLLFRAVPFCLAVSTVLTIILSFVIR